MITDILLKALANIAIITLISYSFIKMLPRKRIYTLKIGRKITIILVSSLTTFILMSFAVELPQDVKIDMRFNVLLLLLYYFGPSVFVPTTLLTAILRLSWGVNDAAFYTFLLYLVLGVCLPFINSWLSNYLKQYGTVLILNAIYICFHTVLIFLLYQDFYQILWIGFINFLFSSTCLILVMYFIEDMRKNLRLYLDEMERAKSDFLTGLYNKREFSRRWDNIEQNHHIYQTAILMLDIDHFKCINDQYGHSNGDLILQQVAYVLQMQSVHSRDIYRVGGEEFCVILNNATGEEQHQIAEKIRTVIEQKAFRLENYQPIHLTVSIGLASLSHEKNMKKLYRLADKALYKAKERGRNRVVIIGEKE